MAIKNDNKDQAPKGSAENIIKLAEKAERLRMAECAVQGGEYRNGQCYK